jgi:hypothetical protein
MQILKITYIVLKKVGYIKSREKKVIRIYQHTTTIISHQNLFTS